MSSDNGNGQPSTATSDNGTMHELAPCSCCMALAHVRRHQLAPQPEAAPCGSLAHSMGATASANLSATTATPAAEPEKTPTKAPPEFSRSRLSGSFLEKITGISLAGNRNQDSYRHAAPKNEATAAKDDTVGDSDRSAVEDDPSAGAGAGGDPGVATAHNTPEQAAHSPAEPEWDEEVLGPRPRNVWQGLGGIAVMVFGVTIPMLSFVLSCLAIPKRLTLVVLNHPIETLAELALIGLFPIINYTVWSALCKHKVKHPKLAATAVGCNVGTAAVVSGACVAIMCARVLGLPYAIEEVLGTGLAWLALLVTVAGGISAAIIHRLRQTRDFSNTRLRILLCSSIGLVSSVAVFAAAEARPWLVRYAEHQALSSNKTDARNGMALLTSLNPERELHMQCADSKAAGLAGVFLPIKPSDEQQLYFALSGKPYSFHQTNNVDLSAMPDDYLSRNIVGDAVPGLEMTRSRLDTVVHPRTMSASLAWTFVFKNDTSDPQEARMEIAVPPGAAIAGLTAWNKGEQMEATFVASEKTAGVSEWTQIGHDSPATVKDLGRGRVLLHCYPVLQDQEYRVRITMALPLRPEGTANASMLLPRVVAANFDMDGEHQFHAKSDQHLTSTLKSVAASGSSDHFILSGSVTSDELRSSAEQIDVTRAPSGPVAVYDLVATHRAYIHAYNAEQARVRKENAKRVIEDAEEPEHPHQVVLMLDGSRSMNQQVAAMNQALSTRSRRTRKPITANRVPVIPHYVVETVERVSAAAPGHLVVVIDGSENTRSYVDGVCKSLAQLPKGIPADVIFASHTSPKISHPMPLQEALTTLKKLPFSGGQDNLQYVVQAAEMAGESTNGAVLWIHGPQPVLNQEIYLMSPFVAAPKFYELTLGTEEIDTMQLFKNHPDIGPFAQVPRYSTNPSEDLKTFLGRWTPNNSTYTVKLADTTTLPEHARALSAREQIEVLLLHSKELCQALITAKQQPTAATIAVRYGFVSPVSCAFIDTQHQIADRSPSGIDAIISSESNAASSPAESVRAAGQTQTFTSVAPQLNALNGNSASAQGARGQEGDAFASQATAGDGAQTSASNDASPSLQGATNGTIGPQGTDATVITGVNTAGTVRVNNLANLEALLNIIANLGEVALALTGLVMIVLGAAGKGTTVDFIGREVQLSRGTRIGIGVVLLLAGLALPGMINWFVASARDANLFS